LLGAPSESSGKDASSSVGPEPTADEAVEHSWNNPTEPRTRTVARRSPAGAIASWADQRGQVERARAAGLLGVRERLDAGQEDYQATKPDLESEDHHAALTSRKPAVSPKDRGPSRLVSSRVAPSGVETLGSGQPYSRAALSLFSEACAFGLVAS
jgi:hypothetical protein